MTISQSSPKKTLVFIDSGVSNYQSIVDALSDDTPWVLLDADQDGVLQMQSVLMSYSELDSIQVISHGSVGALCLGSTVLSQSNLSDYASQLQDIGKALTQTGDLLLYGCNVAQGNAGQAFIESIAAATQADVAASTNLTGNSAL